MTFIVAHRGASRQAHENTLESFVAAADMGADMVELDVRRTADGKLVPFHDPGLSKYRHRPLVQDLTYAKMQSLCARKKFRVPTIEEVFKALAGRVMLDIELKVPGCESETIALARTYFPVDRFMVSSFDPVILDTAKSIDPAVQISLILANTADLNTLGTSPAEVIAPAHRLFGANRAFFAQMKQQGKKIAVWTVDGRADLMALLIDPLVDAVITNCPDKALDLRKRLQS
jgi:glycerophosphoryl diester phosphodiesterase